MSMNLRIGKHLLGPDQPPFIVAEMSCNHNQSLDRALNIVRAAAETGAHALKIQTSTPDTMTLDVDRPEFRISDPKSLWNGKTLYELYKETYTPWEWHEPIFKLGRELGMEVFSTPFSLEAVDFLESLNVPCFKIASFENVDLPLIQKVAKTGKPVIISTGMATEAEIQEAVDTARSAGCVDLILLKCTSAYPAPPTEANLLTIPAMAKRFDCLTGLSDHTLGTAVSIAAVTLGAVFIEKHFTLARADEGLDAAFSLEPAELTSLVRDSLTARQSLGRPQYGPSERERGSLIFRRSLYAVKAIAAGERFTPDNVRSIRPAAGLPPKHNEEILGAVATRNIARGTPISWDLIRKL